MALNLFQKGKFYTLPLKGIRDEGSSSFFIVDANGKEYAIRMFDFQRKEPAVKNLKELPCMVKDVHGDNIVFVQNFARLFADRYVSGRKYQFIVVKEAYNPDSEFRYYDIRDEAGVPFRLKCSGKNYLIPKQKIKCIVSRPNKNKMILTLDNEKKDITTTCISTSLFLERAGVEEGMRPPLIHLFRKSDVFADARQYFAKGNAEWIIKAVTSVPDVEAWSAFKNVNKERLLRCYHDICLFLLEDSDYLQHFSEDDHEYYQEWLVDSIDSSEVYMKVLSLINSGGCGQEIDLILQKISRSGYVYDPHRRMDELIAMFKLQPDLLEEKIDSILDLVGESARNWKLQSFNKAFSGFLRFYVMANRERTNRVAVVDGELSRTLLNRMVRSICFLLLMTGGRDANSQLYKSMLLHYLSYGTTKSEISQGGVKINLSEMLEERSFSNLLLSGDTSINFSWNIDNSSTFAYNVLRAETDNPTLLTRSYEANNIRFTASGEGLTISRLSSSYKDKNVLPQGFMSWNNLKIFLDTPLKASIKIHNKNLKDWKAYWNNVEQILFEQRPVVTKIKTSKRRPDVGTETYIRILWKDDMHPFRYYCKIEDPLYEGEGWIDTYQKGGSIGIFHYDPCLGIEAFFVDGKPMKLKARVNSLGSPNDENPTYTFDCIPYIDDMLTEVVDYGDEADCTVFYVDERNHVLCCVTEFGYGIFVPITPEIAHMKVGSSFRVSVTDTSKPNAIQGEMLGEIFEAVNISEAATHMLVNFAGDNLYEETDEELAEEAMGLSEDSFEADHMKEIVNIIDHKAVLEADNVKAYAFLSIAHILARMLGDTVMMRYLEQRANFLCILQEYGNNGRVDDEMLERMDNENGDMVEKFPLLRQRLTEMRIVNCFGQSDRNGYLWQISNAYDHDHKLAKLSRLMLSYNMLEGFGLQEHQQPIINKIKAILNVNVELPKIYSFGEEDQMTEFKTSIVFPPDNKMKADIKQQTYNIMKVICGMLNSYGGTLYLGVNDTGTARGLMDDLAQFNNNTDKFDLYVRNSIRNTFGDQVNASITVDHPEAGNHYIYAIRIPASKVPVAMRPDNVYFLREASSTYQISLSELSSIMESRNFAQFITDDAGLVSEDEAADSKANQQALPSGKDEAKDDGPKMKVKAMTDNSVATSQLRDNVVNNWEDGYMQDTIFFFRILKDAKWCVLDDVPYEDGLITLAIQDEEKDGSMVFVYDDGKVNKVPISQIADKTIGNSYKMYQLKKPIFVSPAKKGDALLTAYEDDKGKQYLRLDDLSLLPDSRMMDAGATLTDIEFRRVLFCEIVDSQYHDSLKRMHNQKRTTLGMQALTSYGMPEQEVLKIIGIEF